MASECTQCSISLVTREKQVKSPQPENTNEKETGDHMQGRVRTGGLTAAGQQAGVLLATLEVSVEARQLSQACDPI